MGGGPSTALCRGSRQTAPSGWDSMVVVVNVGGKGVLEDVRYESRR